MQIIQTHGNKYCQQYQQMWQHTKFNYYFYHLLNSLLYI